MLIIQHDASAVLVAGAIVIRARLFGEPAVWDPEGREVRLRTRKQLGVLIYLIVDGRERAVSRDDLMHAFWDGVARERAYHSLCQAVAAIRKALGAEVVRPHGEGLKIEVPVTADVEALGEDLDRLDLTRPLDGMDWWGGTDLGHWLAARRTHLVRAAIDALHAGIRNARLAGATMRVYRCAELLYRLDEHSETGVLALAEREMMRGNKVGAIRLLRAHLDRLQQAVGCSPQPAVERLLRRLEAGAHPPVDLVPTRLAAHADRVRPTVVVGRERELALLEGEWQTVLVDQGLRTCVITGSGGMGKTSILRRFAATVAGRAETALVVSCHEMGADVPYAALTDLVAGLLRDPAVSGTDPLWLSEVSRIHPALRTQFPGVPEPQSVPPETIRLRVADGVLRMLEATTDGAAIGVFFDDVQHMDPATRDVLSVLLRRSGHLPLFFVASSRSHGYGSDLASEPLAQRGPPWHKVLPLAPLSSEGTRRLIDAQDAALAFAHPDVVHRIIEMSEGNPQFAEMLLADWQQHATASLAAGQPVEELPEDWEPPATLRLAFARSYAGLDPTAQRLLQVLAVAQRALAPEELAGILGASDDVDTAALQLLARGILRLDEGSLSFKNELHRAYVYVATPEQVRRYHHRIIGHHLLKTTSRSYAHPQLRAALHISAAGERQLAATLITEHAPQAVRSGTPREVESVIRAFLTDHQHSNFSDAMRVLLARALLAQGRYWECLDLADCTEQSALEDGQRAELAAIRAVSLHHLRTSDHARILGECRRALALAVATQDEDLLALMSQTTIEAASEAGDLVLVRDTASLVSAMAVGSSSLNMRGKAVATEAYCLLSAGSFEEASSRFHEAIKHLRDSGDGVDLARPLNGLGICQMALGDYTMALQSFSESLQVVSRSGDDDHRATVLGNIGLAHEDLGDFGKADDVYDHALEVARHAGNPRRVALAAANAANIAIVLGRSSRAQRLIMEARGTTSSSGLQRIAALVELTQADFCLATGEPEAAIQYMTAGLSRGATRGSGIDNNAKALRLHLHLTLLAHGPNRVVQDLAETIARTKTIRMADRLEVEGFIGWFSHEHLGQTSEAVQAVHAIASSGLIGVLGILHSTGTSPSSAIPVLEETGPSGLVQLIRDKTASEPNWAAALLRSARS